MGSWDSVKALCAKLLSVSIGRCLLDAETMMKLLIFLQSMKQWKIRLHVIKRLMNEMIPFV